MLRDHIQNLRSPAQLRGRVSRAHIQGRPRRPRRDAGRGPSCCSQTGPRAAGTGRSALRVKKSRSPTSAGSLRQRDRARRPAAPKELFGDRAAGSGVQHRRRAFLAVLPTEKPARLAQPDRFCMASSAWPRAVHLLAAAAFLLCGCSAAQTAQSDAEALLAYKANAGPDTNLDSWDTTTSPCDVSAALPSSLLLLDPDSAGNNSALCVFSSSSSSPFAERNPRPS